MLTKYNSFTSKLAYAADAPSKLTILFVDDEAICHDAINLMLYYEPCKIISAYTGQEAISLAELHNDKINIIFLDIFLHDMMGYEVYKQIRTNTNLANIPIIFQSGISNDYSELQNILQEQATYVIRKPYTTKTLLTIIKQLYQPSDPITNLNL